MRVSFNGTTYDVDADDEKLRNACADKATRMVAKLDDADVRDALTTLLGSTTLVAVKLGAIAGYHHAYSAAVDGDLIDALAYSVNRMVGLNYVPPERILVTKENEGGSQKVN